MTKQNAKFYDSFVAYYDSVHQSRDTEHAFYRDYVSQSDTVLEVACGSGTLTATIAQTGAHVVGFDLSREMLALASERLPEIDFHYGDMRDFSLDEKFDLVICPFNSLLHLTAEEDVLAALRTFAQHCKPGGEILIDIFNLDEVHGDYRLDRHPLAQFQCESSGRALSAYESSHYDAPSRVMWTSWFVEDENTGEELARSEYTMTPIGRNALSRLLETAGCRLKTCFGSYDRRAHDPLSRRLIAVATPV